VSWDVFFGPKKDLATLLGKKGSIKAALVPSNRLGNIWPAGLLCSSTIWQQYTFDRQMAQDKSFF